MILVIFLEIALAMPNESNEESLNRNETSNE